MLYEEILYALKLIKDIEVNVLLCLIKSSEEYMEGCVMWIIVWLYKYI